MRKNWKAFFTVLLVIAVVLAFSLGAISLASDGHEKIDSGAVGSHTEGWVSIVISTDSNGKTYVSFVGIDVPEGCIVTKIVIVVKGGSGTPLSYTFYDVSSASGMFYAPMNNGGQRADVSHVDVYYWYYCPTPTPTIPVDTPTPTPSDPGNTPTPTPSDPGETPTPTPSDPGNTPTPTPSDPGNTPTPTPRITEPPIPGRG